MNPTIALPVGMNFVAAMGVVVLGTFTFLQVVTTVPEIKVSSVGTPSNVPTEHEYMGIVQWFSPGSITITDTMGVSRTFTVDKNTRFYKGDTEVVAQKYSDIRVLGHVRVTTLRDNTDERAQLILDIR